MPPIDSGETGNSQGTHKAPVVLIVEDDPYVQFSVAHFLALCGITVMQACDGTGALSVLRAHIPVDLVFSEVNLPGPVDGLGLAQWVHTNRPEVPVILTSGLPQQVAEAKALCDGNDELALPKPYALSDVERRIRHLLG
jgi:DNA-binding response OmpR family regulator